MLNSATALPPANLLGRFSGAHDIFDFTDIVDGLHAGESVRAIFAVSPALLARLRSLRVSRKILTRSKSSRAFLGSDDNQESPYTSFFGAPWR